MSIRLLSLLLFLTTSGCNGPFMLMSGGKLEGVGKPVPGDWTFTADSGIVQLETRPEEPYSVNIVYTVLNGILYINAGDTETQWVKNISADSAVRLRMHDVLYDLRAERVSDAAEIAAFAVAWTGQSMFRRDPSELDQVWIYRLEAR